MVHNVPDVINKQVIIRYRCCVLYTRGGGTPLIFGRDDKLECQNSRQNDFEKRDQNYLNYRKIRGPNFNPIKMGVNNIELGSKRVNRKI